MAEAVAFTTPVSIHCASHHASFGACYHAPAFVPVRRTEIRPALSLLHTFILFGTSRYRVSQNLAVMSETSQAAPSEMNWQWSKLRDLSAEEQYSLHRLRQEVFVVEQDCAFLDADGADLHAWHLLGWMEDGSEPGRLVTYLRAMDDPAKKTVKLGRIVTALDVRGQGLGRALMLTALQQLDQDFGDHQFHLDSQTYATGFYKKFGFETHGEEFLEDGIPHIAMARQGDAVSATKNEVSALAA